MLKSVHDYARTGLILIIVISMFYAVAWAGLNRTVGPTVTLGWGLLWDNDSAEVNVTGVWTDSLWEMVYNMVDSTDAIVDSAVGAERAATSLFADSAGAIDHQGIKPWHLDSTSANFAFDGAYHVTTGESDSAYLTHGGAAATYVTIASDQTISGKKNFTDTVGVGEPGTDGLIRIYSEEGASDQIVVIKPHADMTQDVTYVLPADDGGADEYLKTDGSGNLSWATPPGGDPGSAIDDSVTDGYAIWHKIDTTTATVPKADDVDTSGTDIAAALSYRIGAGVITDSIWSSKPVKGVRYSHAITPEDSVATFRFAQEGTYFGFNLLYNFSDDTDDQQDSTWFDVDIPSESPDMDSLVIPAYYTSADDVDSAGFTVHLFKKTEPLGDTTRIYNGSALKTNSAWTHLAIAGGSIDAISGGDLLIILIVSKVDDVDTVKFKDPVPYSPQT